MSSLEQRLASRSARSGERPEVRGKFIFAGDEKVYVRGVTYGAFAPDADGHEYHDLARVDRDFAAMAANGFNTVRIPHTTPPRALLDVAQQRGLRVMVGLSVEQNIGYLIDGNAKDARRIEETLRAKVRSCAGHPALFCYALGNEIPASIVRWLGRRRVERVLERMYRIVKEEDPRGLVSYVNYPSTEYLQLRFLDLFCFNVYLESKDDLEAYLPRLQNISGDKPLLMSEVGLDALRNGELTQAAVLSWQIQTSFARGCAGVFIFSWTDEWYRGGGAVGDWAFGLTDHRRRPKPALVAVREAFRSGPFPADRKWPRISVVVCSYNGSRTIGECLQGLADLEYPDYEVIVVDDGSKDATAEVAGRFGFRLIRTENRGLSNARNSGLAAATGEIVAYIDDDAYPDPDWLSYLAAAFADSDHVGVGGPNVTAPGDGPMADRVGDSPGNPTHVLLTDEEAEHIPGCNMAFRKSELEAIGGFDARFQVAGDDVDVCWRLRERGTLGFSAGAMVWHHRRNTLAGYLKQQIGYGEAEALLERKWTSKIGALGQLTWRGRIYGSGVTRPLPLVRPRIYHGVWGHAPFQSIYEPAPNALLSLPLLPEFYLATLVLAGLSALGTLWSPLLAAIPLLALAVLTLVVQAVGTVWISPASAAARSPLRRWKLIGLTSLLHLIQPVARMWGRYRGRRVPRAKGRRGFRMPWPRKGWVWSETWRAPESYTVAVDAALDRRGVLVTRGGGCDPWDLELRGGVLGCARICMAVEDHGGGRQMVRFRTWPKVGWATLSLITLLGLLAALAAVDGAWVAAAILSAGAGGLTTLALGACARATACGLRALERIETS